MKTRNFLVAFLVASCVISFSSCKKNDKTDNSTDTTTELQTQSDDESRFSNEMDAIANDANTALDQEGGSYSERPYQRNSSERPVGLPLCDATITVDFNSTPRTITLNYLGTNCIGDRTRTGKVIISFLPNFKWKTVGSQYNVKLENLKITRLRDNKSIIINGTKTITNVTGGLLRNLASLGSITHTIKSIDAGMEITFDDGTKRTWQVARQRKFDYNDGIDISITGISSLGNGIAEWGTNRFGHVFSSAITQPLVIKQTCDFRLVSGQITHTGPLTTTTTTFGLDAAGNPVGSCPAGAFYFKIVWQGSGGNTLTYIAPY